MLEATYLRFSASRCDCEPHHGTHRDYGAFVAIPGLKVSVELLQLRIGGSSLATGTSGDQTMFEAVLASLIDDVYWNWKLLARLRRIQNDSNPDQIVGGSGRGDAT